MGEALLDRLQAYVGAERERHTVYPPAGEVYACLHLTPYRDVKVLILGQDPYHGPGQAHGLCFSVRPGVAPPPSLVNIFAELQADLGLPPPGHGCLEGWARQGVLLLDTSLTVRAGAAASHQGKGWETFTDEVIRAVNAKPERVVFILWGAAARRKNGADRHQPPRRRSSRPIPSPLSAHNGFFGSQPVLREPTPLSRPPAASRSTGASPDGARRSVDRRRCRRRRAARSRPGRG